MGYPQDNEENKCNFFYIFNNFHKSGVMADF